MRGLDVYNTKEGFKVAELHYSADPDKVKENGDPIDQLLDGYVGGRSGAAWRKEMEIDFTAYSGQLLCYHIMTNYRDKIVKYYKPQTYSHKYGSIDWGRNNPASFHEYIVDEVAGEMHIHSNYEIYMNNISIPEFCTAIKKAPNYQDYLWISADPSLWNQNQETRRGLRSLEQTFSDEGIIMTRGKSRSDELPIEELLTRWDKLDTRDATFTINPQCQKQIWEFERLRYKEITTAMIEKANPHEQLIDKDNHSWDDWKYFITTWIDAPSRSEKKRQPGLFSPAYNWPQYNGEKKEVFR